jgi:hypothetical protein
VSKEQQEQQEEQQDAENPFLDPPFSRIKIISAFLSFSIEHVGAPTQGLLLEGEDTDTL